MLSHGDDLLIIPPNFLHSYQEEQSVKTILLKCRYNAEALKTKLKQQSFNVLRQLNKRFND